MRPSSCAQFSQTLRALAGPREPPIKVSGKTFDTLFPKPKTRRKAWEGQDKDQYFRERFSHIHAGQIRARKEREAQGLTRPRGSSMDRERRPRVNLRTLTDPHKEYLFGTRAIVHALQGTKRQVYRKIYFSGFEPNINKEVLALAQENGVPIEYNTEKQKLNELTRNGVHNGLVLDTKPLEVEQLQTLNADSSITMIDNEGNTVTEPIDLSDRYDKPNPLGLFIDSVTDAHNMGAILRSAYFFGVDFVALTAKNSASLNPVVAKSSAGAVDLIPVYTVEKPLAFVEKGVEDGWNFVATVAELGKNADKANVPASGLVSLLESGPTVLVLGSEGKGLRKSLLDRCNAQTTIARANELAIDSLNVSVATGVILSKFHPADAFDN